MTNSVGETVEHDAYDVNLSTATHTTWRIQGDSMWPSVQAIALSASVTAMGVNLSAAQYSDQAQAIAWKESRSVPTSVQQTPIPKPVVFQEVDAVDPPTDLPAFMARADAVARVRILRSRTYLDQGGNVITEHTVQVREPLKRHESLGEAGNTIRVAQNAGRVELPDRIIEVQGVQPFRPAEEYVLFLRVSVSDMFEVIHGKHGAFRIGNGTVETDSRSAVAKSAVTLGSDRFLSALRTLGATAR